MASRDHGLAVLRTYLNLRERNSLQARAVFDATFSAGAAIELAERVRRRGRFKYARLCRFAEAQGVPESDLRLKLLPLLVDVGVFQFSGEITDETVIAEFVGVAESTPVQCDQMWERAAPSVREAAAVCSAELATQAPMALSQHQAVLEACGFPPSLHEQAFIDARAAGLLYRQFSPALGEDVLYSPYVWTHNAVDIAEFMNRLPPNERDVMRTVTAQALQHPGISEDQLGLSENLLKGARKVGLIDATRVTTSNNQQRSFVFPPTLEAQLTVGSTESLHDRKLFTAHILYGHRYGYPGTGRIDYPLALVRKLITEGTVSPSSAARTDYLLLETAGVVGVERLDDQRRARLHLLKEDVARDSLDLLRAALDGGEAEAVGNLVLPGSASAMFTTPERDRAAIPEIQEGAEREALESVVENLRVDLGRKVRGEDF
jgi:hypothetical protein